MRHSLRLLLIVVVILFLLAMTQSLRTMISLSQAVADPGTTVVPRTRHIAVFLPEQGTLYFQQIRTGVASAADRYDVAVSYHPIGTDSQEFALAHYSGIDGAIIYPFLKSDEILQQLNEFDRREIPVVLVEQDVVDDWPWTFVGTNNFEMGRRIGNQLENSPRDGRIVVVYSAKSPAVAAEKELIELGITTVLGDRLNAPIMRRQTGLNPLDAEALTYQLLRSEPPITSLVFTDTNDTLAALQVIIDLNLVGEVQVIGFGVTDAIMDHLDRGILDATLAVNPQRIGIEAVRVLSELMETGNAPGYVDTGVDVIRSESQ